MTNHEHECVWELGDIGTTLHVRLGWVCNSPLCGKFLTVTQTEVMLNEYAALKQELQQLESIVDEIPSTIYENICERLEIDIEELADTQEQLTKNRE